MPASAIPGVSVMIPSYNYGRFIGKAISSALAQDIEDLEVVVVDNASTDESWDVITDLARRDSRVRAFRNDTNLGPLINHDRGMEQTRYPKTLLLSADDYLLPGHISRLLAAHVEHPEIDYFHTSVVYVDDENRLIRFADHVGHPRGSYFGDRNMFADLLAYDCFTTTTTTLFNRDHLIAKGNDPKIRAGDYDYYLRLSAEGARFGYLNIAGVALRTHSTQWTGQDNYTATGVQLLDHLAILEKHLTADNAHLFAGREQDIANLLFAKLNNLKRYPEKADEILVEAQPRIDAILKILNASRSRYVSTPLGHQPLISVIVVETEDLHATAAAIDSLRSQSYENFELVLVTNSAIDATPFLLDRASAFRTKTMYQSGQQSRGVSLNDGLMLSGGEIIAYLDPGAQWPVTHLASLASAFASQNVDAVIAAVDAVVVHPNGERSALVETRREGGFAGSAIARETLHIGDGVPLSAFAHRRGILDRLRRFDVGLPYLTEFEFISRICATGTASLLGGPAVQIHYRDDVAPAALTDVIGYLRSLQTIYQSRPGDAELTRKRQLHVARVRAEVEAVFSGTMPVDGFRFAAVARGLVDEASPVSP